ncbi:DUF4199 domain-containing protein [Croceiramulus getboli]|nr:DUF4199 domain-containing protein [Flavobacteriaceae bacterium YJPT1-3]
MSESTATTPAKVALNFGVLLGILSIVQSVVEYVTNTNIDRGWVNSLVGFAILIGVIVYALKTYKSGNGGFMSLSEALKTGMGTAAIGGLIGAVYFYLFVSFIEPTFIDQMMEAQREAMIEQNANMTQEQMDQAMTMTARFMQPWFMATIALVFTLFFGFIVSLIAGLIMKRENPYQE